MPYFTAILRTQLARWQCRCGFLVPAVISNKNFGHSFIFNFKSLPPQLLIFLYMPILLQLIKSSCFGLKLDDGMVFYCYYLLLGLFFCPLSFLLACHIFLISPCISTYIFTSFSSDFFFFLQDIFIWITYCSSQSSLLFGSRIWIYFIYFILYALTYNCLLFYSKFIFCGISIREL